MGALSGLFRSRGLGAVSDWRPLAESAGAQYGVDPALILAIMQAESGGNPNPWHTPGDGWGLMQVTEPTAAWLAGRPVAPDDLLDPETNVDLGTRYLRYQLDRYGGDVAAAVNAYRAGTASGTPRSQSYVARVLGFYAAMGGSGDSGPSGQGEDTSPLSGPVLAGVLPSWDVISGFVSTYWRWLLAGAAVLWLTRRR